VEQLSDAKWLLAFVNNSNVGLGIFDDQLRYVALNARLAAMHGISVESHLGKTLREILGEVALQVEPAFREVFATGRPFLNLEITGISSTTTERRHWVDNLFPLKDSAGIVNQVAVVVVELQADTKPEPPELVHEAESLPGSANEVLRSWKEIAKHVGACVKTTQRWEQHYDFPIRRLERSKGAVVFALKAEVDSWIRMRTQRAS
jgi:transcriptional regulator with PAS, ATPase and Fis domain